MSELYYQIRDLGKYDIKDIKMQHILEYQMCFKRLLH